MDFDDIVRSSGNSATNKRPSSASLAPQFKFTAEIQSLGKKARKAKSWLKQLSTSSEEMDLTEHDMIYFGLEKRIREVLDLSADRVSVIVKTLNEILKKERLIY